MKKRLSKTPPSGLYQTGRGLEGVVNERMLIRLNAEGEYSLSLPIERHEHRWLFDEVVVPISNAEFLYALRPLLAEGFYILKKTVHVNAEVVIPRRSLIRLGYDRRGNPLIYVGIFKRDGIAFPESGYKFSTQILTVLEEVGFRAPSPSAERQLH